MAKSCRTLYDKDQGQEVNDFSEITEDTGGGPWRSQSSNHGTFYTCCS